MSVTLRKGLVDTGARIRIESQNDITAIIFIDEASIAMTFSDMERLRVAIVTALGIHNSRDVRD